MGNGAIDAAGDVERVEIPGAGVVGVPPSVAGSQQLVFGDLLFRPGDAFNFHHHPNQEEVLYLMEGELEAWVEDERSKLRSGDFMHLPAGVVHACFNDSDKDAKMIVALSPRIAGEELGLELVDDSEEEPWASLRG